jgi:hypothetical protein
VPYSAKPIEHRYLAFLVSTCLRLLNFPTHLIRYYESSGRHHVYGLIRVGLERHTVTAGDWRE